MSHRIYHTEGFILTSRDVGETNRLFFVLTPDLGLIRIIAQGVRKMHSKLRGHLTNYSNLALSVVRGKEYWRLISAERWLDLAEIYLSKSALQLLARISGALVRLMAEEGGHNSAEIFNDLKNSLLSLSGLTDDEEVLINTEYVLMLRLMRHLGYIKAEPKLAEFLTFTDWSPQVVKNMSSHRALAAQVINTSLENSHI